MMATAAPKMATPMRTLVLVESFSLWTPVIWAYLGIASLVRAFWLEGEALLADAGDEPVRLSVVREGNPNALANAACGYFCFHRG